jgi:hypothetical protein
VQGYEAGGHLVHAIIFNRRYWISAISQTGGMRAAILTIKIVKTWGQALLYRDSGQTRNERTKGSSSVCLGASWSNGGVEDLGHISRHVVEVSSLDVGTIESEGHSGREKRRCCSVYKRPEWQWPVGRGDDLSVSVSMRRYIRTLPMPWTASKLPVECPLVPIRVGCPASRQSSLSLR